MKSLVFSSGLENLYIFLKALKYSCGQGLRRTKKHRNKFFKQDPYLFPIDNPCHDTLKVSSIINPASLSYRYVSRKDTHYIVWSWEKRIIMMTLVMTLNDDTCASWSSDSLLILLWRIVGWFQRETELLMLFVAVAIFTLFFAECTEPTRTKHGRIKRAMEWEWQTNDTGDLGHSRTSCPVEIYKRSRKVTQRRETIGGRRDGWGKHTALCLGIDLNW